MEFETSAQLLSSKTTRLIHENIHYQNTLGISGSNVEYGFMPAFLDRNSGKIYRSCFSDGRPSAVHLYDALPDAVITKRNNNNKPIAVNACIISGFLFNEQFYTREQTIEILQQ